MGATVVPEDGDGDDCHQNFAHAGDESRLWLAQATTAAAATTTSSNGHVHNAKLATEHQHQRSISVASSNSETAFLPSFTLSAPSYFSKSSSSSSRRPPTFSLSFRRISIDRLATINAGQRLILMLCIPWRGATAGSSIPPNFGPGASQLLINQLNKHAALAGLGHNSIFISTLGLGVGLGVATVSCLGCYCVARLILPRIRVYLVCLRSSLAQLLAAARQHNAGTTRCTLGHYLDAAVLFVREPRPVQASSGRAVEANTEKLLLTAKQHHKNIHLFDHHQPPASSHDTLTISPPETFKTPNARGGRRGEEPLPQTPTAAEFADDELDDETRDVMAEESVWSRHASPRRMTVPQPMDFQDILTVGPNSPIRPIPLQRIGDSPLTINAPSSATLTHNSSITSPSQDPSDSTISRLSQKRLSLNFPVQPASARPSRPPSWHASPLLSPEVLASPTEGNFLTILAHQERRVLELKEELRRAEQELDQLKKQWSNHEVFKKGQETRRGLQLQPLRTNFSLIDVSDDDVDGSQQWLQREMDRRKALLSGVRSSGRKVFSSSRHTRTLSLLSPDKGTISEPFPQSSPRKKASRAQSPSMPRSALEPSSTFSTDTRAAITSSSKDDSFADVIGTPKDAIVRTGKQMVGDIREGLWTFFEDIRQVTVGDEAMSGNSTRTMNGSMSPPAFISGQRPAHNKKLARHSTALITSQPRVSQSMTYDPLLDGTIQNSFWREQGLAIMRDENSNTVQPTKLQKRVNGTIKPVEKASIPTPQKPKDIEDSWDNWGTPIKPSPTPTPAAKIHTQSPSSSSVGSAPTLENSRPSSPSHTSTPQTLTPESACVSQRVSVMEPLNGELAPGTGVMSKRSSGVWATNLAKMAGVEQIKRTATQILADWERGVAADSPRNEQHPSA